MELTPREIKTYHKNAFRFIKYGFLAVFAGISFQAGIVKPLCIVLHQEPVKSEVCENNFSQLGLLLGVGGILSTLVGKFARSSLSNEYFYKTGQNIHSK